MSRQYFQDVIIDPPLANLTAITAASETPLWNVPAYSPIHAFDAYKGAGKIYKLTAGGILSTAASTPGTLQINPRVGTSVGGTTMGASTVTGTLPTSLTNVPWWLEFQMVIRSIGVPGSTSTCIGTGYCQFQSLNTSPVSDFTIFFGGTQATADFSLETGITIGWLWSVTTNSITPQWVSMQSLN